MTTPSPDSARRGAYFVPLALPPRQLMLSLHRDLSLLLASDPVSYTVPLVLPYRSRAHEARIATRPYPRPSEGLSTARSTTPSREPTPGTMRMPSAGSARAATPGPARAGTPDPARAGTPRPARAGTPGPAMAAPPGPVVAPTHNLLRSSTPRQSSTSRTVSPGSTRNSVEPEDSEDSSELSSASPSRESTPVTSRRVEFATSVPRHDLVPRPVGSAGRPRSGGYTLRTKMGLKNKAYVSVQRDVNKVVSQWLHHSQTVSKQPPGAVERAKQLLVQKYPEFVNKYEDAWPLDDLIAKRLAYTAREIKKGISKPQDAAFHDNMKVRFTSYDQLTI
ncbi:hypothetical protein PUNSTDRAFT_135655 [Punctularia strigosozonata HHB-11173 SS5]|uniref:uncharacterized protein n=1 Tax=Punctularia strigosozonata (strain HHB-11173) TaxID=741275 RepID=UPI00044162FC|nr:uncharacterized protein PUNSTDRAFT_135655 [Punctularia strigosozonata HHB-11173 SS5]EIN06955.1 hypothetical protein PUNSTDRAFT_135655 [Punctularia strigosozonata HHB-11173 SS5]